MSDLRTLFDSIDQKTIEGFVADRRPESLHLEFKTLGYSKVSENADRKNLAKAISGFANSDSGIVVWGVVAKSGTATALEPVPDVQSSLAQLESRTAEAASPVQSRILHKAVHTTDGAGFLVTYVPETEGPPVMAKAGEDRYYKRSGEQFRRMEHFDIADMFGRRARPRLDFWIMKAKYCPIGSLEGPDRQIITVECGIRNTGRALARFPFAAIAVSPPYKLLEYLSIKSGFTLEAPDSRDPLEPARGSEGRYLGGAHDVVHAESTLFVAEAQCTCALDGPIPDLEGRYRICADGVPASEGIFGVPGSQMNPSLDA